MAQYGGPPDSTASLTDAQILDACARLPRMAAARELGITKDALRRRLNRMTRERTAPELVLKGTSVLTGRSGELIERWDKTRMRGREDAPELHIPDPKLITKRSTLYDQEGRITQQWISETPDGRLREQLWRELAAGLIDELPRVEPTPFRPDGFYRHLMVGYPVGDHHMGMLAWRHEAGGSYDLEIGERLLTAAFDHLTGIVPPTSIAVVALLGDFLHYDSFEAVTPAHRNLLDADGRFPKMVRATIRTVRYAITAALRRHRQVHVIVELGNHDPASAVFLMEALDNIYENEPRVTVDTSPRHFHYYEFGKVLLGVHHGHGIAAKPDKLPGIMAHDRAEAWGRTTHRYWWLGHVHHDSVKDYLGVKVETFGILPPTDAYAENNGFRSDRNMKAIVFHADYGEVARHTVNPAMLECPG